MLAGRSPIGNIVILVVVNCLASRTTTQNFVEYLLAVHATMRLHLTHGFINLTYGVGSNQFPYFSITLFLLLAASKSGIFCLSLCRERSGTFTRNCTLISRHHRVQKLTLVRSSAFHVLIHAFVSVNFTLISKGSIAKAWF